VLDGKLEIQKMSREVLATSYIDFDLPNVLGGMWFFEEKLMIDVGLPTSTYLSDQAKALVTSGRSYPAVSDTPTLTGKHTDIDECRVSTFPHWPQHNIDV
jgi:hypothetical protein